MESRGIILIEFKNVSVVYPNGHQGLKNVNLSISKGEFVVIVGLSGAGKSTLIRSINQLVKPTSGSLLIDGEDTLKYGERQLRKLRTQIGMIFQNYNLVKRSSVLRNVLAGRLGHTGTLRSLLGFFSKDDIELAMENLRRVNIAEKAYVRADQLRGDSNSALVSHVP